MKGLSLMRRTRPNYVALLICLMAVATSANVLSLRPTKKPAKWFMRFKRNTTAHDGAPLDFERAVDAPIALLGR